MTSKFLFNCYLLNYCRFTAETVEKLDFTGTSLMKNQTTIKSRKSMHYFMEIYRVILKS